MSAVVINFPRDFKASDLGPLRRALADLANKHGLKIETRCGGLHYDLVPIYQPPLFRHKPTYNQPRPNPAA